MKNSLSRKSFTYDKYDRVIQTTTIIDGKTLTSEKEFDRYGRLSKEIYPSGYYINNIYDSFGHLTSVTDRDGRQIWQLLTSDAEGRVLTEKKGTVTTTYRYNELGQLDSICAPGVNDLRYTYYPTGNLKTFKDVLCNQSETYVYDKQDRLIKWSPYYMNDRVYDSNNRITSVYDPANGYRNFQYSDNSKPNAITSSSGAKEIPAHQLTFTDFKKVKTLQQDLYGYIFNYGPDDELLMMQKTFRGTTGLKKYYAENYEENPNHYFGNYHYIYGGNGLAAIYTSSSNGGFMNVYTDILGSLTVLTREGSGAIVERHSYDPYGNRRDPRNWSQVGDYGSHISYRGYTMHEHLYEVGLINMGARIYDPYTSQFISPDPQLQAPENWLNYNRYAYCLNNPLKYTDPDGEFFFTALLGPVGAIIDAACWGAVIGGAGYSLSVAFSDGGFKNWSWNDFGKSIGVGAISGVATYGIGNMFGSVGGLGFSGEIGRAYTHGFAQGMIAQVTGGDFMHGFSSGGIGSLASSAFMMYGGRFATSSWGNYSFSGVSGGIGSVLAGGNFWEGSANALMTTSLNHLQQLMAKPSFEDLLANFPLDENGNEMSSEEVYKLIGGSVLAENKRDPQNYRNACALRVSRSLNGSGVKVPNVPGKTLKGSDNKNYFYRAKDLYNWLSKKYGNPNISTKNAGSLKGSRGIYIMQANYPSEFGAWGHATLYNRTGTIGKSYIGPSAHKYSLWKF